MTERATRFDVLLTISLGLANISYGTIMSMSVYFTEKMPSQCIQPNSLEVRNSVVPRSTFFENNHTAANCSQTCDHGRRWTHTEYATDSQRTLYHTYDLTDCDADILVSSPQAFVQVSYYIGGIVGGYFGDKFGRKTTYTVVSILQAVVQGLLVIVPSIEIFTALWTLVVIVQFIAYRVMYVLVNELYTNACKHLGAPVLCGSVAIGLAIPAIVAYFIQDWKFQMIIHTGFHVVSFLLAQFLWPESQAWLISVGRIADADRVSRQIARYNRGTLTEPSTESERVYQVDCRDDSIEASSEGKSLKSEEFSDEIKCELEVLTPRQIRTKNDRARTTSSMLSTFVTNSIVRRRTILVTFFVMPVIVFSYYLTIWATAAQSGSPYVNVIIVAIIEAAACTMAIPLAKSGTRKTLVISFVGIFVTCCVAFFITSATVAYYCFWVVRTSIVMVFAISVGYIQELYPTNLRTIAYGICMTVARPVAFFSAYLKHLPGDSPKLFWGTLAGCVLCSIAALLFLPETKNIRQPETLDDLEEQELDRIL